MSSSSFHVISLISASVGTTQKKQAQIPRSAMTTTNLILPSAPCGWKGDGGAGNLKPQDARFRGWMVMGT